jgi:hypothetical protein
MPFFEKPYQHGNLYLDFEIIFPTKLNEVQVKELGTVLEGPSKEKLDEINTLDVETESYYVSEFIAEEENTHHGGGQKTTNSSNLY